MMQHIGPMQTGRTADDGQAPIPTGPDRPCDALRAAETAAAARRALSRSRRESGPPWSSCRPRPCGLGDARSSAPRRWPLRSSSATGHGSAQR
jgi:hypothetical protein